MKQKNQRKPSKKLNTEYFKAFIATRGSIGMLNVSFVGLVVTLLILPIIWNVSVWGYHSNPMESLITLTLIGIAIFMLLTLITVNFPMTKKLLFQHQFFSGIWLTIMVLLLTFVLMFMSYMFTQYEPNEIWYASVPSIIVIAIFLLVYTGAMIYNFFG